MNKITLLVFLTIGFFTFLPGTSLAQKSIEGHDLYEIAPSLLPCSLSQRCSHPTSTHHSSTELLYGLENLPYVAFYSHVTHETLVLSFPLESSASPHNVFVIQSHLK